MGHFFIQEHLNLTFTFCDIQTNYWIHSLSPPKVITLIGMALSNSSLFNSAWITFAMLLLMSIAQGVILPASEAMLIDVSEPETRAYMYSLNYWGSNLSMMLGIVLGGWFFKQYMFNLLIFLVILSIITATLTTKMISETLLINTRSMKYMNSKNVRVIRT
ncbi:MFS transporter [Lysinibacillus fusiformis]|uniref:MFS transporter n=1 Tax=Lysinibacillus fusiformis TaxID=28031 RepID=UPI0037FEC0D5